MYRLICLLPLLFVFCKEVNFDRGFVAPSFKRQTPAQKKFADTSWQNFLQNLPQEKKPVVDFTGKKIDNQEKHFAILPYDVGTRDLQQCADALIRLRAEYLFNRHRLNEIKFLFTNGDWFSFLQYCAGLRPVLLNNKLSWQHQQSVSSTYRSLRNYLDVVYCYAGTASLSVQLKRADDFAVGTIIMKPGSPGHCMMIIDEMKDNVGRRYFKLAEGFMPAQSIYV
ncbi:MAG: DUF4846 domain-containing protein, partial [Bacteroidota bacterium]